MKPLRICIDARLVTGDAGGVEQFVIGLATGLSQLHDGDEEYFFLAYANSQDWLTPFLGESIRILEDSDAPEESERKKSIKKRFPGLVNLWHGIDPRIFQKSIPQPKSNGLIEKNAIDVMHFTFQDAFLTTIPSIYHPHDLQHLHLSEGFTVRRRVLREQAYRAFCNQAKMVAVASNFVRKDLLNQYHLPEDKVKVITFAPIVSAYLEPTASDLDSLRKKYSLPDKFVFYPAQTWPHKNHIGLLKALAFLRDTMGIKITAVFSGTKYKFDLIEKSMKELRLDDDAIFLGFVSPLELRGLYKICRCVVIPTKHEAGSFPLWEAFALGIPTACSNVTSLPEQAGDAALLFNPEKPEEIAQQLYRLWTDEELRSDLIIKGKQNVSRLSWELTARKFRAHYRRIGQRSLSDDDKQILDSPSQF